MERQKQRMSRKWLRLDARGRTSLVHADKLQIAEQTGIKVPPPLPPLTLPLALQLASRIQPRSCCSLATLRCWGTLPSRFRC